MNRRYRQSGMVYLTVLAVSMIVVVVGVGALLVVRQQTLASEGANDLDNARMAARSGIELARYFINADPNWRTTRSNGAWGSSALRGLNTSIAVTDPLDSNLSNCYSDSVLVTATGQSGSATQIMQVTLKPELRPLSCLAAAVTVNGALAVKGSGISSDGLVSCNSTISGGGPLNANAEAFVITNLNGSGSRTILSSGRAVPGTNAFDYYIAFGTAIDINSIGGSDLKGVTLSPTSNPWGLANSRGIYVIDCLGESITVEDATISGTLVLLNPESDSQIKGAISFTNPNVPGIMVNGSININVDKYPVALNAPLYVSGALIINGNCTMNAPLIVGGDCTVIGGLTIGYDPTTYNNPPEGFYQLPCNLKPVSGSWKPAVN